MSKFIIGLLPYDLKANDYIKRNREILEQLGTVVEVPRPKLLFVKILKKLFRTGDIILYDILILNFREGAISSHKNYISFIGCIEFYLMFCIHKIICKKLIYVRHNLHPHNLPINLHKFSEKIIKFGQLISNVTVSLSPAYAKTHNCHYVPHPLYETYNFNQSKFESKSNFIVFGRIERYKNIDELINCIDGNIELIVMGPCTDIKYLDKLKELSLNKKVRFEIGFHSDNYLQHSISSSSGVIITNQTSSMIVSGSFFYAISCGAKVFTIKTPFTEWIKSTSLGPYVLVENNVESLMKKVSSSAPTSKHEHEEILRNAELIFGDSVIEDAWRKIVNLNN